MKILGILLMLAGWLLMPAAVILLRALPARTAFALAGMAVEILGLVFVARDHILARTAKSVGQRRT